MLALLTDIVVLDEKRHQHIAHDATPLWGPKGLRRSLKGLSAKRKWLDTIAGTPGSYNTIMLVLTGATCKGFAQVAKRCKVHMYEETTQQALAHTCKAAFGWDAATYSGFSVNVGGVVNLDGMKAYCLKPMVMSGCQ